MNTEQYQEMKRLETQFKAGQDVTEEAEKLYKEMYPDPIDWQKVQYYTDLINMSDAEKRAWYVKNINDMGNIGDKATAARGVLEPVSLAEERKKKLAEVALIGEARRKETTVKQLQEEQKQKEKRMKATAQEVMQMAQPVAQQVIKERQAQAQKQYEQEQRENKEFARQNLYTTAQQTSKLPFETKYYEKIDFGDNAGRTIYRVLTPWIEEKGETHKTFIEAIPDMYTGKYDTQERLKERYEAEQSQKLWTRILLGGDTVIYKDGKYFGVAAGEAPLVTPSSKAASIPVNMAKITKLATEYKLNPSFFSGIKNNAIPGALNVSKQVLESGKKITGSITGRIRGTGTLRGVTGQIRGTGEIIGLKGAAKIESMTAERIILLPQLYIDPVELTEIAKQTLTKIDPDKIIQELNSTKLAPVIFLNDPETMEDLLTQVDLKQRTKIFNDIMTKIRNANRQQEMTDEQTKAAEATLTKMREATETATKTATRTKTKTQTETKPQELLKTTIATTTVTKAPPKLPPPTTPKPPKDIVPPPKPPPPTPIIPNLQTGISDKKIAEIKKKRLPVCWRQGFGWWVIKYPYKHARDMYFTKRKPSGAFSLKGVGSAYRTLQALGGNPQILVRKDLGIVNVVISENKIHFIRKKNIRRKKKAPELIRRR